MKVGASVLYPLSKGSGHVAGESTWCRSADIGTPNCVAHVGEVTPSIGEEGVYGRCWEVQDGDTLNTMFIRGHMCSCLAFWERELCAPPWVLDTVKSGYVLPFYSLPTPYTRPNQCTALIQLSPLCC